MHFRNLKQHIKLTKGLPVIVNLYNNISQSNSANYISYQSKKEFLNSSKHPFVYFLLSAQTLS